MRHKRTGTARRMRRAPEDGEAWGTGEDLPHWLLRMETGWGMPHDVVAIAASFAIFVGAIPSAVERMAARWRRWFG